MGIAYVNVAVTHSSDYRVMFGRFIESCSKDPEFVEEARSDEQAEALNRYAIERIRDAIKLA